MSEFASQVVDGATITSTQPAEALSEAFKKAPETPKTDSGEVQETVTEPEAGKESEAAPTTPEKTKKPDPRRDAQARIDVLTREKREQERRADEIERKWRESQAELERMRSGAPRERKPTRPMPTMSEHETVEEAMLAVTRWEREQEAAEKQEKEEFKRKETAKQAQFDREESFKERIREHLKGDPGFWDSVSEEIVRWVPVSTLDENAKVTPANVIAEYFMESDTPGKIIKHLSDNPETVQRLFTLPPLRISAELGRIEERLGAANPTATAPKPQVSRANQPVRPVTAVAPSATDLDKLPDSKLSDKEWARQREAKAKRDWDKARQH